ncbi:hypothetical protein EDB85DRAFT_2150124 [Lactarius pseudohatsudake]|nr:hypothetical protein EDB85DRAFT_2150124 [Lactarius pseudohatsudake]
MLFITSPPHPPRSPRRAFSPRITPQTRSIVEDNNSPTRGVKTIETSVLDSNITSPTSTLQYYPPIFLPRACKMPQDPDEVAPVAPITRKQSTTPIAPPSTEPPVAHQHHADTVHHHLRATAAEFVPRPTNVGPTQVDGVQLALQQPASYLTRAITRLLQNVIGTGRPSHDNPRPPDANTVSQHAMSRTLRHRPRIRYSQTQDRHARIEQEILTPVRADAAARIRERVQIWCDQIIYEPPPRLNTHHVSRTHDPMADERTDYEHRDYEYDDYQKARREH